MKWQKGEMTCGIFFHGIVILHHGVLDDVADFLPWLQLLLLTFHEKVRVCHPGKMGEKREFGTKKLAGIFFPREGTGIMGLGWF